MGTVGLSFGSPTSGAGFDVSATVTQIVSNLQNVETPWKNQLTALKSQDTALSSIGTLLSTVSTDLGNLTEFTGVMAQKTGSSSDNNVVQLTNASSSAIAGTHTITVTSLAATSSGYLDPITASDLLKGSISIQVGSGKTHTINVNSSTPTLAGLQAAINAAGIGVTASVLTDSLGSRLSLVSGTSGGNGSLTVTSSITDTSNSNASLSYNLVITGVDASLNVDGVDLHSASNTVTNLIAGVTFQLLAPSAMGSDGATRGPVQVIIGNDNAGVETAINQFVTDYNALIAAINTQQGKDSSGNPEPLFGSPTLSLLQQQLMTTANMQNPSGYIDPVPYGSTLSGSVTLQVGSGTAQTVDVPSTDTSVAGLANAINAANLGVTAAVTTNNGLSTLTLQSQTAGKAGALDVQPSLISIKGSANTSLNYTNSSDVSTLANLGITVSTKADGSLTFDQSTLDAALNSDFSGVLSFFQNSNSWGQVVTSILNNMGTSSTKGILSLAEKSNSAIEKTLNADVTREDATIAAQKTKLTAQLNLANEILQQIPSQLQGVNELYSAISGYNRNPNGG